jgi:hypothetical protein
MFWLFKFSGVVGVLVGVSAILHWEGVVGKESFISR